MFKKLAYRILRDEISLMDQRLHQAEDLLGMSYATMKNADDLRPALTARIEKAIPLNKFVHRIQNPQSYLAVDFVLSEELTASSISASSLKVPL